MEGAVRSGYAAAEQATRIVGKHTPFVVATLA